MEAKRKGASMLHLPFSFQMSIAAKRIVVVGPEVSVDDSPVAVGRAAFADNGVVAEAHIAGLSMPGAFDGALLRALISLGRPFALDKHTAATRETHLDWGYENTWPSEMMTCLGLE